MKVLHRIYETYGPRGPIIIICRPHFILFFALDCSLSDIDIIIQQWFDICLLLGRRFRTGLLPLTPAFSVHTAFIHTSASSHHNRRGQEKTCFSSSLFSLFQVRLVKLRDASALPAFLGPSAFLRPSSTQFLPSFLRRPLLVLRRSQGGEVVLHPSHPHSAPHSLPRTTAFFIPVAITGTRLTS